MAGLVISRDIFSTNRYPDAHFCTCAEISHAVVGSGRNSDDHIVVGFRVVEIKDGTYPLVGQESVRMILQPLSDGSVSARWQAVDRGSPGQPADAGELLAEGLDAHSSVCSPLVLGEIPEPEEEGDGPPSFLLLKDPGAGWQIWRRLLRSVGDDEAGMTDGFREESYSMVFPLVSAEMNWRFRVYEVPGGGARVEIDSGRHR